MKQEEFFKLLDRRLSVIEDGERQDILEEYRQHIAMKIREDHVSEEEALADFGDVDSFADEILSAYHVRTGEPKKPPVNLGAARIRGFWARIRGFFGSCDRKLSRFFGSCRNQVRGLFHRQPRAPKAPREGQSLWKVCFFRICSAVRTLLRWCFNLLFGGLGLMFWGCAAFLVVALGACIVVVTQGYPLVGAAVGLLGLLLVNGSLGLLFCRMIRKKEDGHNG